MSCGRGRRALLALGFLLNVGCLERDVVVGCGAGAISIGRFERRKIGVRPANIRLTKAYFAPSAAGLWPGTESTLSRRAALVAFYWRNGYSRAEQWIASLWRTRRQPPVSEFLSTRESLAWSSSIAT